MNPKILDDFAKNEIRPGTHLVQKHLSVLQEMVRIDSRSFSVNEFEGDRKTPSDMKEILNCAKDFLESNQSTITPRDFLVSLLMYKFPKDVLASFKEKSQEVINELIENDPKSRKIYDAYEKFRISFKDWANVGDRIYYDL